MPDTLTGGLIYQFGPFELDPVRRTLTRAGEKVSLTPRMFDALLCLVQHGGQTVERTDLIRAVWGARIVDEANLKQTIYGLRKVLGAGPEDRLICTIPSRGYSLGAPVRIERALHEPALASPGANRAAPENTAPFLAAKRRLTWAIGLSAAGLAGALLWWAARPPPQQRLAPAAHSVAVLPFADTGGGAAPSATADGVSAELIDDMAQIPGLHVAASSSSFQFRAHPQNARDIARQLNVGMLLEGSVRRATADPHADTHIAVQLIDAGSGFAVWSRDYDAPGGDAFATVATIAQDVAGTLGIVLPGKALDLAEGGTRNPEAYNAYLRGMKLSRDADDAGGHTKALREFDAALTLDPRFAVARAGRAREMALIAGHGGHADPASIKQQLDAARAEDDAALALAPHLAMAHLARYDILMLQQNFAEAVRAMDTARQEAPGDSLVLMEYVYLQLTLDHAAEALAAAEQGVALDPLSPAAYLALAWAQHALHDDAGAMASARRARFLGADIDTVAVEATIALDRGDYAAARQACGHITQWQRFSCLAIADYRLGHKTEALADLAALRAALGESGAFQYAEVYSQWGQLTEAAEWLQTAYRLHDTGLMELRSDLLLAPIRNTPQFASIQKWLQFPP